MSAILINGKQVAKDTEEALALRVEALKERGITPGLAVILVGDHPASISYVTSKEKACARLGMASRLLHLPESITQAELAEKIQELNTDDAIDGILIQLPLPQHLDTEALLDMIDASKDVDGFHDVSAGRLSKGREGFVPCTPKGILRLLTVSNVEIEGKRAVVIGRSNLVGKPAALLLLQNNATVTICHSRTQGLAEITKQADILIAAVGKPHFVTEDMVKEGAVVIDVGIHRIDGKLTGDVDFETVKEKASAITPVPGGVGPMTVAMLMENTVEAAERRHRS